MPDLTRRQFLLATAAAPVVLLAPTRAGTIEIAPTTVPYSTFWYEDDLTEHLPPEFKTYSGYQRLEVTETRRMRLT